jgi:hypothetical protein
MKYFDHIYPLHPVLLHLPNGFYLQTFPLFYSCVILFFLRSRFCICPPHFLMEYNRTNSKCQAISPIKGLFGRESTGVTCGARGSEENALGLLLGPVCLVNLEVPRAGRSRWLLLFPTSLTREETTARCPASGSSLPAQEKVHS